MRGREGKKRGKGEEGRRREGVGGEGREWEREGRGSVGGRIEMGGGNLSLELIHHDANQSLYR